MGQDESCMDVFVRVFHAINRDQCALIGMVCWILWNHRNKWVWERANSSAFGVKATALNLLADWRRAHEAIVRNVQQGVLERRDG